MPESAPRRRLLPLIGGVGGGRSAKTCLYRCGNACFHPAPNKSDNPYFGDIFQGVLSRRTALKGAVVGSGAGALGWAAMSPAAADRNPDRPHPSPRPTFKSVLPNTRDEVSVPEGYDHHVIIRWGDPVLPDAPEFDFANQTGEAQARQFGYNCDYVGFFTLDDDHGLLWVNHEYTNEEIMFAGYTDGAAADPEWIRVAMAAHGGSVVELERVDGTGQWRLITEGERSFNRRITPETAFRVAGPAAGHALLRTEADPEGVRVLGMLNNCAGGMTPWGTILSGEENFNQYFVGAPDTEEYARYGFPTDYSGRRWDRVDERFDLARHPNEAHRFGYIVEIDPHDPDSTPVKRTMLGRFKHEGANVNLTEDGRVAAYMGDDERFDYLYKFVSDKKYVEGSHKHNMTLLDTGTLYVAHLEGNSPAEEIDGTGTLPSDGEFDGTGAWIPLCSDTESFVAGFSVAEVLIHTRLAADTVGATKMDRPEDVEPSPVTGKVYCALTNNSSREPGQADEPNPRGPNKFGHVLEIIEDGADSAATTFAWIVPLVCGDPEDDSTYYAGYDKSKVMPVSAPDNLAFDKHGNLWISTDGQPSSLETNDALHVMPVEGRFRGELRTFATVPVEAETCGPLITEDQKTVFLAPQHPGENGTVEQPTSVWPDGDFPRPSVVCAWHKGGRDVGA
ncbi:PhoX family phosphatase [Nocardiopsis sp. MG754419]|uniref:PhoX family protein n=1 Tax=Nocardiopsis sp. MG754419 TaxID=2259865 RepID=UPI001BAC2B01|nr:PhoX family phosphatase [Nocardiopsis sp. MG754419]MBR8740865.1 phosphatase [Nocardiopsis sp. MG754419]